MADEKRSQHTPGPWICEQSNAGRWFVQSRHDGTLPAYVMKPNSEANARLIAAAPDYDAAARVIVDWWEICKLPAEPSIPDEVIIALDDLRAAIAKAEGRDDG